MGKVVSSLVSDILMPIIGIAIPGGEWRDLKIVLTTKPDGTPANAITYGAFVGSVVDFVIIAAAVFLITRMFLQPGPAAPDARHQSVPWSVWRRSRSRRGGVARAEPRAGVSGLTGRRVVP